VVKGRNYSPEVLGGLWDLIGKELNFNASSVVSTDGDIKKHHRVST